MRVLFCKTSWMKYYKGPTEDDPASYGGSYVAKNGWGHESWNFVTVKDGYCYGFVEPKRTKNKRNQLHIERISDRLEDKNIPYIDDVLVVWCAVKEKNIVAVVGWYQHARVYRFLQQRPDEQEEDDRSDYNIMAKAEDCVLLPRNKRDKSPWSRVPVSRKTRGLYGFGSAMVWYANENEAQKTVSQFVDTIQNYNGENWRIKDDR